MDSENNNTENTEVKPDELALLKERATVMGITFHPGIGIVKLKAKIAEKTAPSEDTELLDIDTVDAAEASGQLNVFTKGKVETAEQRQNAKKKDALRLVRIRVANMNPIKGNIKGEIVSVGNATLGFTKKFIPFNAEHGWHVPNIIVKHLKSKMFMSHYEVKIGNKKIKKNKLVPEYAIEILVPLTSKELNELKQRQIIASGGQD